jgi:hypothetical protein
MILDVFTVSEWVWVAGLSVVLILTFYVVGEFVKIVRRD